MFSITQLKKPMLLPEFEKPIFQCPASSVRRCRSAICSEPDTDIVVARVSKPKFPLQCFEPKVEVPLFPPPKLKSPVFPPPN